MGGWVGDPVRAELGRDPYGFWVAYVEAPEDRGEEGSSYPVMVRHPLPVPSSATREEAEAAFRRFMSIESRCGNGPR